MGIEGVLEKGFVTTGVDTLGELGANRLNVAHDLRLGLLCR